MTNKNDELQAKLEAYFEYGIDIENRRIFLSGDIDEETIDYVIKGIYYLSAQDKAKSIELVFSSLGGSEYEMYALYDIMNTSTCDIHTFAVGKCMSATPLLVAAGKKEHRWAGPNTWFMVHDSWDDWGAQKVGEMDSNLQHYKAMAERWYKIMARLTKKPMSFWRSMCEKTGDSFFDADQALEWGVVDYLWDEKHGEE